MAFEIVDGMTGTKHISSDDLAALNTATVGKADCVLHYGDDFKLTMASANSATLGTGVGMVGGKRFWNQAATSLTIQSGTQGQKRHDLVVARYQKTSAGIESITPVVIKGTPTTGAAADPATTANDLKLWRVPLDGINAGAPVRLFEPVTPLATLGESVSQLEYDTGWVDIWESSDTHCHARRIGGIVYVRCEVWGETKVGTDWTEFTRLPEGMRPDKTSYFAGSDLSGDAAVNVRILTSGLISVICKRGDVSYWTFSASFPAA